jgi:hypothetical protein
MCLRVIYIYIVCVCYMQISVYIYIYACVCVQYTSVLYTCPIRKTFFLLVDSSFPYCLCVYHCLSMCYLICYMQNYTQLELYIYKYACMFFSKRKFYTDNMP